MRKITSIILSTLGVLAPVSLFPFSITSCGQKDTNSVTWDTTNYNTNEGDINFSVSLHFRKPLADEETVQIVEKCETKITVSVLNYSVNNTDLNINFKINANLQKYWESQKSKFTIQVLVNKSGYNVWKQTTDVFTANYVPGKVPEVFPENLFNIQSGVCYGFKSGVEIPPCGILEIPSSVTTIEESAFENALPDATKEIRIPSSVIEIKDNAFKDCILVEHINLSSWDSVPEWTGKNIFSGFGRKGTLALPSSTSLERKICAFLFDKLPGPWTFDNYALDFIADRTFSLLLQSNVGATGVLGTCWIVGDATPETSTDYTYYVATNWHVSFEAQKLAQKPIDDLTLSYADYYDVSGTATPIPSNKYHVLASSGWTHFDENTSSVFSNLTPKDFWIPSIDLSVYKINFNSIISSDPMIQGTKDKLDRVNNFHKAHGKTTWISSGSSNDLKLRAIGGYPKKEATGPQWDGYKNLVGGTLRYYDWDSKASGNAPAHSIGNPIYNPQGELISGGTDSFYAWDASPQFYSIVPKQKEWMCGGSSGSLVLNEDYCVDSIYWGGFTNTETNQFYPSFSVLSSHENDFLKEFNL